MKFSIKQNNWTPWKNQNKPFAPDKMIIPLPIPHPVHIAVIIYNRDSDNPIPLESELCQNILQGIEDGAVLVDKIGIDQYHRASHYETMTTSSSSETAEESPHQNLNDQKNVNPSRDEHSANQNISTENTLPHQWTLGYWGQRKRNNSGTVRVDLASPEDVTLDSDSTRVMFSAYGTTV